MPGSVTMKNRELIELVSGIIHDSSYSHPMILARINKGVGRIAAMVDLPDLKSDDTVETSTLLPYVSLPSEAGNVFHRKARSLFYAASQDQEREVNIMESWIKFLMKYSNLNEAGDIVDVCVRGGRLYYQPAPSASDTLDLHFFREPVKMRIDTADQPDGIPEHLQEDLLVNFSAWDIFKEIEDDGTGKTPNTDKYLNLFGQAIAELKTFIGPADARPVYYDYDEEDYT